MNFKRHDKTQYLKTLTEEKITEYYNLFKNFIFYVSHLGHVMYVEISFKKKKKKVEE
jgi:hypothetical protein